MVDTRGSEASDRERAPNVSGDLKPHAHRIRAHIHESGKAQALLRFVAEASQRVKPRTLTSYLDPLIPLAATLENRPFKEATRDDVIFTIASHEVRKGRRGKDDDKPGEPLAASTKYQWGIHIRTFYRWLLQTDDIPPQVARLPFRKVDTLADRAIELALKPTEVRQLLSGTTNERDRFIILLLIETGLRASEAAALLLSSLHRRKHGYRIVIPADAPDLKTGPRNVAIPLIAAAKAFKAWLAEHPRREDEGAPLLVTLSHRSHGNRMTGKTVGDVVVRAAKRAGMRHVHAHMLRHTSATLKVAKGMEPQLIRLIHGWTKKSTMLAYYSHIEHHIEAMVMEAYNLEPDEPELLDIMGATPCSVCGASNAIDDAACSNCRTPLAESMQVAERHHRADVILAFAACKAVVALRPLLYTAVARAMGAPHLVEEVAS